MTKLGLYGGTFDPVHYGHLRTANSAREELELDRLMVVANPSPPHKAHEALTPYAHRKAMLQLALREFPGLELGILEENSIGPAYTTDTVKKIIASLPKTEHELWLIVGADSLIELPQWKDPEALFRYTKVAVLPRPGFNLAQVKPAYLTRVRVLNTPHLPISATEIRKRLQSGADLNGVIPASVEQYIHDNGLYRVKKRSAV